MLSIVLLLIVLKRFPGIHTCMHICILVLFSFFLVLMCIYEHRHLVNRDKVRMSLASDKNYYCYRYLMSASRFKKVQCNPEQGQCLACNGYRQFFGFNKLNRDGVPMKIGRVLIELHSHINLFDHSHEPFIYRLS